jgi:PPOX class probable F420-dependent enzyme
MDLIAGPHPAALATVMPDGQPQSTVVWCNTDGVHVLLNTMRGFQKEKNMRRNPRVTIFACDPTEPLRNIEVRGRVVEMTEQGAVEHNDQLTMLYTGKPHFFGDAVPAALQARFTPVICKVLPTRVRVEQDSSTDEARQLRAERMRAPLSMTLDAPVSGPIPASHIDLLLRPVYAILTTMMPDGQPQSSLVWCDYDGAHLLISTTLERRKSQNMLANSKITLLVIDPANSGRYMEMRGEAVGFSQDGAVELADRLTQVYTGKERFYGDIYAPERQAQETRIVWRIQPRKVNVDAIFG